ncbi:MAG: hypothetical protein ABI082_10205 [Dokdonella sp.]
MNRHDVRIDPISAPTLATAEPAIGNATLALRLAQRAFAACMEDASTKSDEGSAFPAARVRAAARRTLSALSADDRPRLDRWLILQLATGVAPSSAVARRWLARVDSSLSGSDGATVSQVRDELCAHSRAGATA